MWRQGFKMSLSWSLLLITLVDGRGQVRLLPLGLKAVLRCGGGVVGCQGMVETLKGENGCRDWISGHRG
jgi:hypothetical protein